MSDEEYRVGPGRPPRDKQWKKGCPSPNPFGRPPTKSHQGLFAKIDPMAARIFSFDQTQIIKRTPEGTVEITHGEAALAKLFKEAMSGDYRALRDYLKITEAAQKAKAEFELNHLGEAIAYRRFWLARFEYLEARGKRLPNVYPDPRDIEIGSDGSVEVYGPVDAEGRAMQEVVVRHRDEIIEALALMMGSPHLGEEDRKRIARSAKRKVSPLNKLLPPRLRRSVPRASTT